MGSSRQYTFRLPDEVSDAIESIAKGQGKSGHQVAREFVEETLRRRIEQAEEPGHPPPDAQATGNLGKLVRDELAPLLEEHFDAANPPWSHVTEILEAIIQKLDATAALGASIEGIRHELKDRLGAVEGDIQRLAKHFPKLAELLAELVSDGEQSQADTRRPRIRRHAD